MMNRLLLAFKAFWLVLKGENLFDKPPPVPESVEKPPPPPPPVNLSAAFDDGAVYSLVLLQRAGRLIDFIQEDITDYGDEQVGAAVRQIHADTRKVFGENFELVPIIPISENESFSVERGFDAGRIMLTGDVPEEPPFTGRVRHKGWFVKSIHFPTRSGKIDPRVIQTAEVEIE